MSNRSKKDKIKIIVKHRSKISQDFTIQNITREMKIKLLKFTQIA